MLISAKNTTNCSKQKHDIVIVTELYVLSFQHHTVFDVAAVTGQALVLEYNTSVAHKCNFTFANFIGSGLRFSIVTVCASDMNKTC